jgi:Leu/Phe-tRNA-protein transferase
MKEKSVVYYLTFEDIKDENILFNYIYANENSNFYISDDLSKDFYINQANCGFISTSIYLEEKFYLVPEMQFEYAILDFEDLHISKKVKKLLNKNDFIFTINKNFDEVIKNIQAHHETNWLSCEYHQLLKELLDYKHPSIDFEVKSFEVWDKSTNTLIAGEIGYKISATYTSLTGFCLKDKKYNNFGKLQLVLLAKYLQENNYSFWNLGHPYMQYKFDLGAKIFPRKDFLKRWLKEVKLPS